MLQRNRKWVLYGVGTQFKICAKNADIRTKKRP